MKLYFDYDNNYEYEETKTKFRNDIKYNILKRKNKKEIFDIVFLCIGTDKLTGDSFGPLVGTILENQIKRNNISNINIYGTLEKNISYTNVKEVIKLIGSRHPNSYIITIDAALSDKNNIGKIFVEEGKTIIGKGLNKEKIEVGDLSIKGVIGKKSRIPQNNFYILQNTSLNRVIKLADIVSEGLLDIVELI